MEKYDWEFKLSERRANKEDYGETKIVGNIYPDPSYPGCLNCKGNTFVVCGSCVKLNCNNSKKGIFTCEWCGAKGEFISYDGAGINSAGDV